MKLKKTLALALAFLLTSSIFAGCTTNSTSSTDSSSSESSSTASTEDDATPTGTVKILAAITGGKDDAETELFAQAISDATGLDVVIEKPASDYDTILMQKIQAGEAYDLIYLGASSYLNLVEQGALLDITDKVEASSILSNNVLQSEWDDITIDGKIYAGFNKTELHRVVGLNRVHLEEANIDYTTIEPTLDGYYEVFKALKETKSASDSSYYPLNIVLSDAWDIQPWMASASIKGGVMVDDDGETYVPYSTDEAAPVWEWLKKLYDEQLLDPSSFVDKTSDMRSKQGAASQLSSVNVDWAMWVGLHNANAAADGVTTDTYEIVSLPGTQTADGDYMLAKGGASLFGVPANSENPDGAIAVLEYFATQEGGELLSVGIEGHDYEIVDGTYTQTEIGTEHANDHGAPVPIYKDFTHPIGYNLGVEEALTYLEYASTEMTISNEADYKEIVGKWGIQIVKGDVSVTDGLAQMRSELVSRGVCTK